MKEIGPDSNPISNSIISGNSINMPNETKRGRKPEQIRVARLR